MNIKYITNVRIPTPRAQGYAIMKMCHEFAKAGAETELFVPNRKSVETEKDSFGFYGIEKNFEIKKIPSLDLLSKTLRFGRIFYWIDILSFLVISRFTVRLRKGNIIYTRDFMTTLFFPKKNFIALEIHDVPKSKFLFKWALKKAQVFFVLNRYIKEELISLGAPETRIFISPSGVDLQEFGIGIEKDEARRKVGLSLNRKVVLYTGHLYKWKGADTLAEAAKMLPEALFVFVGGVVPELGQFIDRYKECSNIIVRPSVERSIIPVYLKSADVLVLPNSAREKISEKYTSPIKLFEYMASKRPIVASSLPSVREVLNESNCLFAEADNPTSFAESIKRLLSDQDLSEKISREAFKNVARYTWQKKAEDILMRIKDEIL